MKLFVCVLFAISLTNGFAIRHTKEGIMSSDDNSRNLEEVSPVCNDTQVTLALTVIAPLGETECSQNDTEHVSRLVESKLAAECNKYLGSHDTSGWFEDFTPTEQQHTRRLDNGRELQFMFVYLGHCRYCWGDNGDGRRLLNSEELQIYVNNRFETDLEHFLTDLPSASCPTTGWTVEVEVQESVCAAD